MHTTVVQALEAAHSTHDRGFTFLDGQLEETRYSFAELAAAAEVRGRQLLARGLQTGDRVGIIIPDSEEFVLTFLGAVRVGVVPVPMYPPLALGKLDSYIDTAANILRTARAKLLITTKQVSPILWSLHDKVDGLEEVLLVDKLAKLTPSTDAIAAVRPSDPCFLQFTSGSTSDPKGVVVTHENLAANAKAVVYSGLKVRPEQETGVSWLPLYHDMGLIGFVIAPVLTGIEVVFIPTLTFVKRPTVWMDTINRYRGTLTFAPNFAFALAARRAKRQVEREDFDLSCLRVVGCGAEPINPSTMRAFIDAYAPAGLNENTIMPCYGMAEATLAMAFEPLDRPFTTTTIDRDAYEDEQTARPVDKSVASADALEIVACGHTFPDHKLAIMDDAGTQLEEGRVGEIAFSGPSVTVGYFENEEATSGAIKDGWLRTGDLGFILDDRIYISGRKKDLIILNGRNYHPQAIEWEVEQVQGVRKGNVVCFAVRGDNTEKLVVVAESKSDAREELVSAVLMRVKQAMGLVVGDVVVVSPGSLPKTSSGKLQRSKTKRQYEQGTLGSEVRTAGKGDKVKFARHITNSFFALVRHRVRKVSRAFPGKAIGLAPFGRRERPRG